MGKLITMLEAAEQLGISQRTMRYWIEKKIFRVRSTGGRHYLDEDTIKALQDTVKDVEHARQELETLRETYRKEREILSDTRADNNERRRLIAFSVDCGIRNDFFKTIVRMLQMNSSMTEREAVVLIERLNGKTLQEIGDIFGLTRERIRQISEKAIRRSRDLILLENKIQHMHDLQADNEALKSAVASLQKQLDIKNTTKESVGNEEARKIMDMCKTFSTRLVDCSLSVRAVNCLTTGDKQYKYDPETGEYGWVHTVKPCDTIGDVCRMTRVDFLKLRNAGRKTLNELDEFLTRLGLSWGMDVDKIYEQRSHLLVHNNY